MRRAAIVLLILLSVTACSHAVVDPGREGPVVTTMAVEQQSGARLFELSRGWLAGNLFSDRKTIEYENPAQGIVVANGTKDYPAEGLDALARVQYTISFQVRAETGSGRITLAMQNVMINVPKIYDRRAEYWLGREYFGGFSRPPVNADEYAAVRTVFSQIVDGLRQFLDSERHKVPKPESPLPAARP
jgi:hypothetical protein